MWQHHTFMEKIMEAAEQNETEMAITFFNNFFGMEMGIKEKPKKQTNKQTKTHYPNKERQQNY